MPTGNEILRMQSTINGSLPTPCAILRPNLTDDGRGGKKNEPTTIQTKCRLSAMRDRKADEKVGESIRPGSFFLVTLPSDAKMKSKDQLRINGVLYKIENPVDETSFQLCKRFHVSRVNPS